MVSTIWFKVLLVFLLKCVFVKGLSKVATGKEFTFPDSQPQPQPQPQAIPQPQAMPLPDNTGLLPRQAIPGTAIVDTSVVTCICVPTGFCVNTTIDGTGIFDVRIVNNPTGIPTTPTTSPLVCQTGLVRCCQVGQYRCGVRYPPIQGAPAAAVGQADFGEYPWQAAILSTAEVYVGSGVLIDNRHVLTAAHKVYNVPITTLKVRLGEWDASSTTELIPAQEYLISRVFVHPNFDVTTLKNDIALLRLTTNVNLGQVPTITTACLPVFSFAGQRCYVSGWGRNDFGPTGAYQAIQKEVDVPIRTPAECQSLLAATRLGSTFAFDNTSFICAGGENGKDACTGDGGAPLVCQFGSRWFAVGLVAWGIGCATANVPGVYVNVGSYVPWIQTILVTP